VNVLTVYAHPEPTSFSAALRDRAKDALTRAGHQVVISDLYGEGFNPVAGRHDFKTVADPNRFHYQSEQALAAKEGGFCEEIAREQARVADADLVVLLFPLWWGGVPAILKGWFDRVLAYGFAYVDGYRFDTGLFKGRRALFAVTTGGTEERFGPTGVYGEIEKVLWQVKRTTLEYMGYEIDEPFIAYAAPRVSDEAREDYLAGFERRVMELAEQPVDRSLRVGNPLDLVPAGAWARKS